MTYTWFALMGGFCVNTSHLHNTLAAGILRPAGILLLAKYGYFLHISDEEIDDKSKADYLAKALVCVQVTWFVAQIVQRKVEGLPVALLEFHSLVNIGCAVVTYLCWFTKPLDIKRGSMRWSDGWEDLLATMLFKADMPDRPKFEVRCQSKLSAPEEQDLWCWRRENEEMVIQAALPHIAIARRDEALEARFKRDRPRAWGEVPEGEAHILPVGENEVVAVHSGKIVKKPMLEEDTEDRGRMMDARLKKTYDKLRTFDLSLSVKDKTRLDLVRQYIAKEGCEKTPPKLTQSWTFDLDAPSEPTSPSSERVLNQALDLESQTQLVEMPLKTLTVHSSTNSPALHHARIPVNRLLCISKVSPFCITEDVEQGHNFREWDFAFEDMSLPHIAVLVSTPSIVFTAYGLVHMIPAWTAFPFPSTLEKKLWLASCYLLISPFAVLAGFVVFCLLVGGVYAFIRCVPGQKDRGKGKGKGKSEGGIFEPLKRPMEWLALGLAEAYLAALMAARMYLVVEAFISLRRERVEIFQTPERNWLDYFPHI